MYYPNTRPAPREGRLEQMPNPGPDASMTGMLNEMIPGYVMREVPQEQEDTDDDDVPSPIETNPKDPRERIAGAGPEPIGDFPATTATGGTLTDFTKRRNWAQRVVEELQDFIYILTAEGRIVFVSESAAALVGFAPRELEGKFIKEFIHPDDSDIFIREFHESIALDRQLRTFFRFRKRDEGWAVLESRGHPHYTVEPAGYSQILSSGTCAAFFLVARPFPTKNAALLDSFLEHKIENIRLQQKIAVLRQEEAEELAEINAQRMQLRASGTSSDLQPSENNEASSRRASNETVTSIAGKLNSAIMPPPTKPLVPGLTRQNLEDAAGISQADSMEDKMARYEGQSHFDTVELLTGLHYTEGERSRGISTGEANGSLIRDGSGISIPPEREANRGDKKKKAKIVEDYVCTDCGSLESPEWRKGPSGRKTLCNACGLRWAKREKKQRAGPSNLGSAAGGMPIGAGGA